MGITREEYDGFRENWDDETRALLDARMTDRYRRETLEHFSPDEGVTLRAILDRLIPHAPEEGIDLVGFLDAYLTHPLGRGDRVEGMPPDDALVHQGLIGVDETARAVFHTSFAQLSAEEQDEVLTAIQQGTALGETWKTLPSPHFFLRLYLKALHGYCAHPLVWLRMGFPGPSYPEGYLWIDQGEIMARRQHFPGWKTL